MVCNNGRRLGGSERLGVGGGVGGANDGAGGCFDVIFVDASDWSRVWRPDIYVENSVRTDFSTGFLRLGRREG